MPLYEYQCSAGHVFDDCSTIADRHAPRRCKCGASASKVILHPPRVFGDYEGYESPASGKWIEGRRARLEDLARTGCRPYEAGEREDLERRKRVADAKLDASIDEAVERTLAEITS